MKNIKKFIGNTMSNYDNYNLDDALDAIDTIVDESNELIEDDTESEVISDDDILLQKVSQNKLADNLSITITAQAGQVMLSIQQLLDLSVDQIIDIAPLPPKVSLLANGITIGDGYLVELNGRLGVKIARLNSNKSHGSN